MTGMRTVRESIADPICATHGLMLHVVIHECSHAVFGLALNIDFINLTINLPRSYPQQILEGKPFIPGALTMRLADPTMWVAPAPEAALDFLISGSFGERQILGHELPGGFQGDIDRFKLGCGVQAFEPSEASRWIPPALRRVEAQWADLETHVQLLSHEVMTRLSVASDEAVVLEWADLARITGL
jgi:hypothetical protein